MTFRIARLVRFARALGRDETGSLMALVAGGIVILVAFVGLATDAARGYMLKSRLSQALDAAALAGGRVMFSPTRDAEIAMYFNANLPPNFMNATIDGPHIDADDEGEKLTLTASATIPTTFMRVLGINTMNVGSLTEVTRETSYLDVVLAIDLSTSMTGSAGGTTKIEAARNAATTLVNILFGDHATKDLLKIGIVPWSAKVNVTVNGQTFDPALTQTVTVPTFKNPITQANQSVIYYANNSPVPLLDAPQTSWKGCVYARYRWGQSSGSSSHADTVIDEKTGSFGTWKGYEPIKSSEGEPVAGGVFCTQGLAASPDVECTPCYNRGITPLTNTKATIVNAINQLTVLSAEQSSFTNLPQGLLWAWNVITPEQPFNQADPDPPGNRIQAIVFLTDGENFRQYGDAYKRVLSESTLNTRAQTIGTNIRNAGIKIYTIQFGDAPTTTQVNLMKNIASDPDSAYYFYAPTGAALESVFTEVANHLSQLRLSK